MFYLLILLIPILNAFETKICINCKFCIPNEPLVYSKCFLFPMITRDIEVRKKLLLIENLVTGIKTEEFKYKDSFFYCSTSRLYDGMCGIEGNKFIKKIKK